MNIFWTKEARRWHLNRWIAELRRIAYAADIATSDGEKPLPKTKRKKHFCIKKFETDFNAGLTPKESFDKEYQRWIDNA